MSSPPSKKVKAEPERRGLAERLAAGESILAAEGYLLAMCRMGYLAHGVWVAEVVLEQPEVLRSLHYEFIHAGTDVTEAFQYYTHRERMRMIGREDDLEKINRTALRIAREVAHDTGTLFAGGISNTDLFVKYDRGEITEDPTPQIREMFEEQIRWSKEEGVDYMIGETFSYLKEAKIALEVIQSFDLPAVITLAPYDPQGKGEAGTVDGVPIPQACRQLLDAGALLVGVNCTRGPGTMIKVIEDIVKEVPPEKVCALPVAYRTTEEEPTFMLLKDKTCPENNPVYPNGLDAFQVSEVEIVKFTQRCMELGLKYIGICCGNTGNYTRAMAETMGRKPRASYYRRPELRAETDKITNQKIASQKQ